MNAITGLALPVIFGFGLTLILTGCVGYVQGDGGGGVVMAEPDLYWFGGYGDGGYARGYGVRGGESRGFHGGGGRR